MKILKDLFILRNVIIFVIVFSCLFLFFSFSILEGTSGMALVAILLRIAFFSSIFAVVVVLISTLLFNKNSLW